MPLSPRTLRPISTTPTFKEDQGYARVWGLTTKSSGDIFGSATSDTGHYAVKWWDNTVEVNPSGDPFSKPAAGGKKAFEVYPVSEQGTSLLLHFDGTNGSTTFTDSSSNGLTVTANGDAEISTAQSKFGSSSGYFDGASYVECEQAENELTFGEGDFTVEFWMRDDGSAAGAFCPVISNYQTSDDGIWMGRFNSGDAALLVGAGGTWVVNSTLSQDPFDGEWRHVAIVRDAGNLLVFVDGLVALSTSISVSIPNPSGKFVVGANPTYSQYFTGYVDELRITKGQALYTSAFTPPTSALTSTPLAFNPSGQFNSFDLSDNGLLKVRSEGVTLAAGTAGYTQTGYPYTYVSGDPAESGNISNNSLSSQALDQFYTDLDAGGGDLFVQGNPGIDGDDPTIATGKGYTVFGSVPPVTSLLLNFNGTNGSTVFTDSSPNELTVTASGDAEISTAQSKYGGSSGYFDGDGDGLSTANNPLFDFADGDFTVEAWVRPTGAKSVNSIAALRAATDTDLAFAFYVIDNSTHIVLSSDGTTWAVNGGGAESVPDDAWTHVAFVRHGDTVSAYANGVLSQSHSFTGSVYASAEPMRVGLGVYGAGSQDFQGYIDDLRIIKGQALYTGNFTPPTAAFPSGAADPHWDDVSLLLHMDSNFDDSSAGALTVNESGTPTVSAAHSVFGGAGGYFDGSSHLALDSNSGAELGTSDFTLEGWIYPTVLGIDQCVLNQGNSDATGAFCLLIYSANAMMLYGDNNNIFFGNATLELNEWVHFAMCREGSQYRLYINGVLDASYTGSHDHSETPVKIGQGYGGIGHFNGYMDEIRITKGVARYTTNFTPPAAQLTVYP